MTRYAAVATKAGERVRSAIGGAQDAIIGTISTVNHIVGERIPELPAPLAGKLPAPRDVIDTSFGIAERVLEAQKTYATTLVSAFEPLTVKVTAAPKGAKTAKKTAKA